MTFITISIAFDTGMLYHDYVVPVTGGECWPQYACRVTLEKGNIMTEQLIRRIDGQTGRAEWHTLHEWNEINGYTAVNGELIFPDTLATGNDNQTANDAEFTEFVSAAKKVLEKMIPNQSPSTHSRLTPCFRCGRVYGPGMIHRCR